MLKLLEVFNPVINEHRECIFRQDLTDNTLAERALILQTVKDLYGPTCIYQWHDCGHGTIPCEPCRVTGA